MGLDLVGSAPGSDSFSERIADSDRDGGSLRRFSGGESKISIWSFRERLDMFAVEKKMVNRQVKSVGQASLRIINGTADDRGISATC